MTTGIRSTTGTPAAPGWAIVSGLPVMMRTGRMPSSWMIFATTRW
jgi:hypothetical protein